MPLHLPPLRERDGDVIEIAKLLLTEFAREEEKEFEGFSADAEDLLLTHSWPGNVRELRNVIERSMILHSGQTLHIEITRAEKQEIDQPTSLKEIERNHILSVLTKTHWKVSGKNGAGEALGLKESTLRARMAKLGIKRNQ